MADLQTELQKFIDSIQDRQKAYDLFAEASKNHNEKIIALAEMQPIDIKDFEEAEELYSEMVLNERSYRIQKEVFAMSRREVILKLTPVQNIKIKFTYVSDKTKDKTDFYIWLKYNPENPEESQLFLQKLNDESGEPLLF